MDKWNELRTAYWVAELGTVTAAADRLSIHRATVVRHVEALEAEMGGKLFQRHRRGYTLTETGQDLLRVVGAAMEQFEQLAGRTRGRSTSVTGELVITSVNVIAPLLVPALRSFLDEYPDTTIRYEVSARVYELAYGEAHVAIRSGGGGSGPNHPDNVVRPFITLRSALYAHRRYIAEHGMPGSVEEYDQHRFVADAMPQSVGPTARWLRALAPRAEIGFASRDGHLNGRAILDGLGIGFLPTSIGQAHPDLVEVHPTIEAWDVPFWLVTHVDLHWTAKVQAILRHLHQLSTEPTLPATAT